MTLVDKDKLYGYLLKLTAKELNVNFHTLRPYKERRADTLVVLSAPEEVFLKVLRIPEEEKPDV